MDDLNSRMEEPMSVVRFRPNLVLCGGNAFDEDNWAEISIGTAGKFWLLSRSPRYDPKSEEIKIDVNFPMWMWRLELKTQIFHIKLLYSLSISTTDT
jgi:MOSC domain